MSKAIYIADAPREITVTIDAVRHKLTLDDVQALYDKLGAIDGVRRHNSGAPWWNERPYVTPGVQWTNPWPATFTVNHAGDTTDNRLRVVASNEVKA